jgi:hypothetical protein
MYNNINKLFKFQNIINSNSNNCYFFMYFKFNTINSIKLRFFFRKYGFRIQLISIEKVSIFNFFNKIFIAYNKNTLLFFFPDILLNINLFKLVFNFCSISCFYINNKLYYLPYLNLLYKNSIFISYLKLINIFIICTNYFFFKKNLLYFFIRSILFFYIFYIFNLNYIYLYNTFFFKYI